MGSEGKEPLFVRGRGRRERGPLCKGAILGTRCVASLSPRFIEQVLHVQLFELSLNQSHSLNRRNQNIFHPLSIYLIFALTCSPVLTYL